MEWLEGEDLSTRLARQGLTVDESVRLLRRTLGALSLPHDQGVLHRDLKPANLFLRHGEIDQVTLIDFGLARPLSTKSALTVPGSMLGTPAYMAPEQARGDPITASADVFALGSVLFECLTGAPLHAATSLWAMIGELLFGERRRARRLRPELPPALDALVARMLAQEPTMRPASAAEALRELEAIAEPWDLPAPIRAASVANAPTGEPTGPNGGTNGSTNDEQISVSVIVAVQLRESDGTLDGAQRADELRERQDRVCAELARKGASAVILADASIVASVATPRSTAVDLATRAARCALHVREQLPGFTVAVATGYATTSDGVPVGAALDRAGQLLEHLRRTGGSGGTVLTDPLTAALLDGRFLTEPAGDGIARLTGALPTLDEGRLLLGKPTPCVGRERELTVLEGLVEACRSDSRPRAMLITAPPGIGKSRLRQELVRRLRARGEPMTMLIARGDAMSPATPYGMAAQLVCQLIGSTPAEPRSQQSARLQRYVDECVAPDLVRDTADFLAEICQLGTDDTDRPRLRAARQDPRIMRDQVVDAWVTVMSAASAARPLLLILDDLHWGDALTIGLVDATLRSLPSAPLLVLALARPEIDELFPALWHQRGCDLLRLAGLERSACEQLVHTVLDASPAVAAQLAERSTGNPLYLEELIRAASRGRGDDAPETVIAMLQARFMLLSPAQRRVLRLGSVFGQRFWRNGILALLIDPDDGDTLDALLHQLVDAEIIEPQRSPRFAGETEYALRHALYRDAAYGMLKADDRRRAHRHAADFLERAGELDPLILAEHLELGGERERAAVAFSRAADRAISSNFLDAALASADRGLACAPEPRIRGSLRAVQALAHFWRSDFAAAARCGDEGLALVEIGTLRWCQCAQAMSLSLVQIGEPARFAALSAAFLEVVPSLDAVGAYQEAASVLTVVDACVEGRAAADIIARMEAVARRSPSMDVRGWGWLAYARAFFTCVRAADPWAARMAARAAVDHFEEAGDRRMAACARAPLGSVEAELGELEVAAATLRDALALLEPLDEPIVFGYVAFELVLHLARHGAADQLAEARELATTILSRVPGTIYAGFALCALAHLDLRCGDIAAADVQLAAARPLAIKTPAISMPTFLVAALDTELARGRAAAAPNAAPALALANEAQHLLDHLVTAGSSELLLRIAIANARAAAGDLDGARDTIAAAHAAMILRADRIPDEHARARFRSSHLVQGLVERARALGAVAE
jgi:hypothetical protein